MAEGAPLLPAVCVAVIGVLASRGMVRIGRNLRRWLPPAAGQPAALVTPLCDNHFMAHSGTPTARSIELARRDKAMALAFVPRCRELFAVAGKSPQPEQCDA